jgi:quinol monooxygenase YgiN
MRRRAFLAGSAAMLASVAEGDAHEAKDTTGGLTVMVTRRVQAGKEPEAEAVLRDLQAATLANDEGCLRYEWYRASTPQTYILLERWADPAAAQKHVKSPHFVSAIAKLSPLVLEKPEVVWLTRL